MSGASKNSETGAWLPFDEALVDSISAAMDLRTPNAAALAAVAEHIQPGDGREVVCDLATGVGKTYLAAALVDYLARSGVRNVLFVTPGTTIYTKTIENFTPGSAKFVAGAETQPVLITADNFQRGQVGDALHDPSQLKLFVFNVQQLIRPGANASRRTREDDEFIGGALYEHLREASDLVIIADEHHVYRSQAKAFSSAIRDLAPRVLVGLTATPDPDDVAAGKVIYQYSLAEAIADRLVKIPVIVYRQDGLKDIATQLTDACRLRAGKEAIWHSYADSLERPRVSPVLFVVCQKIEDAMAVSEQLTRDDLLPEPGQVLLITSQSSDAALAALAAVEAPDSPVRAIVSVDKLKEGWDVRNIGVIVALRALASQTLSEQILGRGLRLPFGERTDLPAIDQVDVVAHESYRELLRNKDALVQRMQAAATAALPPGSAPSIELDIPPVPDAPEGAFPLITTRGDGVEDDVLGGLAAADILLASNIDSAERQLDRDRDAVGQTMRLAPDAPEIEFPRSERVLSPIAFSLSEVDRVVVEQAGHAYGRNPQVNLIRRAIDSERNLLGELTVRDTAAESLEASQEFLSLAAVRDDLVRRVQGLSLVQATLTERAIAFDLVDVFLRGAGVRPGEEANWTAPRAKAAEDALAVIVRGAYQRHARQPNYRWNPVLLPTTRQRPAVTSERWAGYVKGAWYTDWDRSIEEAASFDSETGEWKFAHLVDGSVGVRWWLRLYQPGETWIHWQGGRYFPDFIVIDTERTNWVVEVKSDRDARSNTEVADKAKAAHEWIGRVNEARRFGRWRYVLVTESDIAASANWEALVDRAGAR